MPAKSINQTDSPLKKKYGQRNVARARDLMKARLGIPLRVTKYDDKLTWGIIGKISQNAKKANKNVTMRDIKAAQASFKKNGVEPSLSSVHRTISRMKKK